MLKVYTYPKTRGTRVLWALEEAGAKYELIKTSPLADTKEKAYLQINPGGKVPAFVHDDFVLTESAAICTYIADLYPSAKLIPEHRSRERAEYNQWCFFAMTELEQPLWSMVKHHMALPEKYRLAKMLNTANYEFNKALEVFAQQLGDRKYLVGDHFTCADVIIASILQWAKMYDAKDKFNWSAEIENYRERLTSREAFLRVMQIEQE